MQRMRPIEWDGPASGVDQLVVAFCDLTGQLSLVAEEMLLPGFLSRDCAAKSMVGQLCCPT